MVAQVIEVQTSIEVDVLENEALAKGLLAVDGSRRVGWAKAFEALRRVDGLEEDIRQTRDELKYLRRAYSRLLGLIDGAGIQRSPVLDEELSKHFEAERSFRHEDAWDKGKAIGELHYDIVHSSSQEEVEARGDARSERKRSLAERTKQLKAAARDNGHRTRVRLRTDGGATVSCSCGQIERFDEEKPAYTWQFDHLSREGFGVSFPVFKRAWKKAGRLEDLSFEGAAGIAPTTASEIHAWLDKLSTGGQVPDGVDTAIRGAFPYSDGTK